MDQSGFLKLAHLDTDFKEGEIVAFIDTQELTYSQQQVFKVPR